MSKITPDWNKIYSGLSPKLLGICRRYIQDIYTAEDIVHDSFITAIQKNDQLNDEKALFAWLKKIVINNALQHIRKHSKDTFVSTEPSEIPDTSTEMDHPILEDKNILIYDFTNEELLSSIDSLPPHHKSVFNLYFIENHSHAEISGLLGITVNTSKSHLLRAKKSIQSYLLNNCVSQNTPKNKIAQVFVIFGLGGLLWAQTFKSKFADFTIPSSRKLQIPPDIKTGSITISYSNRSSKNKMVIGFTFLIIIITSLFLVNRKTNVLFKNHMFSTTGSDDSDKIKAKASVQNKTAKSLDQVFVQPSKQNTSDYKEETEKLTSRSESNDEKIREIRKSKKNIISRDSIDEAPQRVIVVKKVITRDTIFIEK
ncbi:RNA polymerase sigma factor [Chryseobacterium profundimaris]|uniref:RNA polymerase sigma factor, sigma-70 family n=1 Tax=Chryseobacterium profundimaris TaxID=1387275 RepID=A0ABY1P376_9FLAO|nr:sigma-70 family RNA polymerase sigma factor [Chryseobacterium profundimaris]SMP24907.1 RNA polymerase sigma factor, sigma-70 family [Chryseobacterium profundimaris]